MSALLVAWFISYISAWTLVIYFGFLWSQSVKSGTATAAWMLVCVLLASVALGVLGFASRLKENARLFST